MTTRRTGLARAGLTAIVAGFLLAIFGFVAPAEAAKPNTFKVELCHRTNAPTNPYRIIEVSVDASNGAIVGPDHTGHPGPVFDFAADPADPEYPYTTPRNGDQWGDIIPPYEYDGGSFPGMNWEDGEAILEAGCQGPDEEPDPTCPEGQVWVDGNEDGILTQDECQTPTDPQPAVAAELACASPSGMKVTLINTGDVSGLVDITSGGAVVHDEVVVPVGEPVERIVDVAEDTAYDIAVVGVETFTGTRDCEEPETEVGGVVIPKTPEAPVKPAVQVKGVQVQAQELPRTGDDELTLALIGLGLVLVGGGALLLSRDHATA